MNFREFLKESNNDLINAYKSFITDMELSDYIEPDTTADTIKNIVQGYSPKQQTDWTDEVMIATSTANDVDKAKDIAKSAKFIIDNAQSFLVFAKNEITKNIKSDDVLINAIMDRTTLQKWKSYLNV